MTETMTKFQALALIRSRVGFNLRLTSTVDILSWEISEETMTLVVQHYRVNESKTRTSVTPTHVTAYVWTSLDGVWCITPETIQAPVRGATTVLSSRPVPATVATERREWALMCYRPGTDKSPMDGAKHDFPTIR